MRRATIAVAAAVLAGACAGSDTVAVGDFDGDCADLEGPGAVVAVDSETGALLWHRTIGDATGAAVTAGIVAGTGPSGAAFGADTATGELRWCEDLGGWPGPDGSIVAPGFSAVGTTFATADNRGDIVAVDAHTGRETWRTTIGIHEGLEVGTDGDHFTVHHFETPGGRPVVLDAATGTHTTPDAAGTDEGELTLTSTTPYLEDRQLIDVSVARADTELWHAQLPGFVAALDGDNVIVIDQTGGTGDGVRPVDTRVTAYDATTGTMRWQTPLPGTPQFSADAGPLTIIPSGTVLYALDDRSGQIVWETDTGSPGAGGRYSQPGSYQMVAVDDGAAGVLVGIIVAERPRSD